MGIYEESSLMSNNLFYKALAAVSTTGIVAIAGI